MRGVSKVVSSGTDIVQAADCYKYCKEHSSSIIYGEFLDQVTKY